MLRTNVTNRRSCGVRPNINEKTVHSHQMSYNAMADVINSVKVGDKLSITFANLEFKGDERKKIYNILSMQNDGIFFENLMMIKMESTAAKGKWGETRTFIVKILKDFNRSLFITNTIGENMLEKIKIITKKEILH